MKSMLYAALVLFTAMPLPLRASEEFQIKGLRLGASPDAACEGAPVTSKMDDFVSEYRQRAPDLVTIGAKECSIVAETFGGLQVEGAIDLLFLSDRLIQVKFDLKPTHWTRYGSLYGTLEEMYGAPKVEKSDGFTTHAWLQSGHRLSVSRLDTPSGVDALEIILRNEASFRTYEERADLNSSVLQRLDSAAAQSDIRN